MSTSGPSVSILVFMSCRNFMLISLEHEKSFITSGPGVCGLFVKNTVWGNLPWVNSLQNFSFILYSCM